MKDALARRDQPGIHALSNSYVATLRDVQTRTVAAMRQGSDPSAGLQATDDSVRRQAILLAELRRNAPTSTQRDLSRSLDAANHGQVVSSQRLAAIRAWRESGTGGPPPWAGRGGGPGGDPKHPAHGRAGHPSKGQANDDSGDDDARGQGTNGGGRHSEHGHGGGHGQGKGHGKR